MRPLSIYISCSFWSPEHDWFYVLLCTLHPSYNQNENAFLAWDLVSSLLLLSLPWLRFLLAFTLAAQSILFSCSLCLQGLPFQVSNKCNYINFSKAELRLCLFCTSTLSCPLTLWESCVYPRFPPQLSSPGVPGDTLLPSQEAC